MSESESSDDGDIIVLPKRKNHRIITKSRKTIEKKGMILGSKIVIDKELIGNLMLIDKLSQAKKEWLILKESELQEVIDKFRLINDNSIKMVHMEKIEKKSLRNADSIASTKESLRSNQTITEILKLGKGCISLCGGKLVDLMCKGHAGYSDYDFFFHSCKPEEATQIILVCLNHIAANDGHVSFTRNKGCITAEGREKYQFILRLYDNCSQILGGFDIWTSRIGYNLELGLFSTIQGAFSIATGYFPIDVTRRSTSYGSRIDKYHRDKKLGVLFPGLDLEINEALANKDPFIIKTPDGDIYMSMVKSKLQVDFTAYNHNKSDYDNGEDYLNWWFFIKNKPELLSFTSFKLADIITVSTNTIKQSLREILKPPNERSYTLEPNTVENLFNYVPFNDEHTNLCREFKEVYYINRNMLEATNIWKIMSEWYIQKIL